MRQNIVDLLCVCVCIPLDQELFSGMYIDFMGTDAAIFRSLTKRNAVRTDQHNSKWLSGEHTNIPWRFWTCINLLK